MTKNLIVGALSLALCAVALVGTASGSDDDTYTVQQWRFLEISQTRWRNVDNNQERDGNVYWIEGTSSGDLYYWADSGEAALCTAAMFDVNSANVSFSGADMLAYIALDVHWVTPSGGKFAGIPILRVEACRTRSSTYSAWTNVY